MPAYGNIDPAKTADADQLSRPKSMISQRIGDYKNIMNTNRKLEEASFTNGQTKLTKDLLAKTANAGGLNNTFSFNAPSRNIRQRQSNT